MKGIICKARYDQTNDEWKVKTFIVPVDSIDFIEYTDKEDLSEIGVFIIQTISGIRFLAQNINIENY